MAGRPTSLTPEVQATIIAAIEAGNYKVTACALAGIHRDTLNDWEHRGARGEEPFKTFSDALQKAEAVAESTLLNEVMRAEPGITGQRGADVWQSRAWVMERRWPKRWSGRVRMEVSEQLAQLIERLKTKLDEATLAKVVDATREDAGGDAGTARH